MEALKKFFVGETITSGQVFDVGGLEAWNRRVFRDEFLEYGLRFEPAIGGGLRNVTKEAPAAAGLFARINYEAAKRIYELLLKMTSREQHPREYAQVLTDLGYVYMNENSYLQAQSLLESARKIERSLGNNWQASRTSDYLAWIYFHEGRYLEAEKNLREALRIREELLGPAHPSVIQTWENYSKILRQLGKEEEADEIERRTSRTKTSRSIKRDIRTK